MLDVHDKLNYLEIKDYLHLANIILARKNHKEAKSIILLLNCNLHSLHINIMPKFNNEQKGGFKGGQQGRDNRGPKPGGFKGGFKGGRGAPKVFVQSHRLPGVFVARGAQDSLVTKNMVPGESVYNEKRISVEVNGEKI